MGCMLMRTSPVLTPVWARGRFAHDLVRFLKDAGQAVPAALAAMDTGAAFMSSKERKAQQRIAFSEAKKRAAEAEAEVAAEAAAKAAD